MYEAVIWLGTHGSVSRGGFAVERDAHAWVMQNIPKYPLSTGYIVRQVSL